MGNMIGAGVFLLPASLAPYGWNGVFAWGVAIGGTLVLAMVLVQLTRAIPQSGGSMAYVGRAFGGRAEFLIGWGYLVSVILGIATLAVAAVSYASSFFPAIGVGTRAPIAGAIVLVWALTFLNMAGLLAASGFQLVTLALKIVPLIVVVVLAAWALVQGSAAVAPLEPAEISLPQVGGAAALVLFALLGFECAGIAGARVERPQVTIPRATLIGAVLTGLVYMLASSAIVLLMPPDTVAGSPAPFATFVARFWSAGPAGLVAAFAVISCVGALNGWVLVASEMTRDMAARGELPGWFARVDARGTPLRALTTGAAFTTACLLLNASGSMQAIFEFLLLLATSAALWFYLAYALAALKLGVSRYLAVAAVLYSLWTFWGAGLAASGWSVVLMLAGLPIYYLTRRRRAHLRAAVAS